MNPVIIQHVGCHVCGVKAGDECIDSFEGQNGHGDRMDVFRVEAPYEARLQVHLESEKAMDELVKTFSPETQEEIRRERAEERNTGSLWLRAEEIRALEDSHEPS